MPGIAVEARLALAASSLQGFSVSWLNAVLSTAAMPSIDEETAGLREELASLVDKVKAKQEAVRDDAALGQPGSK